MKPRSDLVLQIASTSDVAKTQRRHLHGRPDWLRRLSADDGAVRRGDPRPRPAGVPAGAVRQHRGARHRRDPLLLVQQRARTTTPLTFLVKLTPGGVMSDLARPSARVGDDDHLHRPARHFFLRETERPLLLFAGGTGLAPILAMLRKLRDRGSTPQGAPGLRRQHRRRPGGARQLDGAGGRSARIHLGPLRFRPGHHGRQQGLRDEPDPARAPATTATSRSTSAGRRRWSRRCASTSPRQGSSRPASTTRSSRSRPARAPASQSSRRSSSLSPALPERELRGLLRPTPAQWRARSYSRPRDRGPAWSVANDPAARGSDGPHRGRPDGRARPRRRRRVACDSPKATCCPSPTRARSQARSCSPAREITPLVPERLPTVAARRLPDRRGTPGGPRIGRDLRGAAGPRAGRAGPDPGRLDQPAAGRLPAARRVDACPTSTATASSTPRSTPKPTLRSTTTCSP